MGKIALLVSREEMLHQAHNILQEKQYELGEMKVIKTEDTVAEARSSITEGATIIIARGLQASLIKQYTDIPVVEIVLTAQEMALLVVRAKQIVGKDRPVIAVVGFKNMFCDMSHFDTIYDIELRTYFAERGDQLSQTAGRAVADHVDLIIGGDTAVGVATVGGIASLFLSITEDSLKHAFSMAESMDYAMSVEKKNAAQMETLLDYSFNGIVRLDGEGAITSVNPLMEHILGEREEIIAGRQMGAVFPDIDKESMRLVLEEGKEYSLFMQVNRISLFAVLAPVLLENGVDGAILTCHKMKKKQMVSKDAQHKQGRRSRIPLVCFGDIRQLSIPMQECIRLAKLYSMSDKPVVIMGEPGTEKHMIAQSIHNSGLRSEGIFMDVCCYGLSDEAQHLGIFGEKGAAILASGGSLLIQDADRLTCANQYRLYQLIRHHICGSSDSARVNRVDVRVILTVTRPLIELVKEEIFREDLYYLLSGLVVKIPPLCQRREDLEAKISECIKDCCERYSLYHVLTRGAFRILLNYRWRGNLIQIESFCERLILTAGKRSVDEITVNKLLRELYPDLSEVYEPFETDGGPYECREAVQIRAALAKFGGSREKAVKELGISRATLWRHMKKYEIK